MKKLMKFAAASVVAMGMVGQAQATVFYSGPMSGWTTVTDTLDGDSLFTNTGYTLPGNVGVTIGEVEIGGIDTYTVVYDFSQQPNGGLTNPFSYVSNYSIQTLYGEYIQNVGMDSTVPALHPNVNVTKNIYGASGALITSLSSVSGNPGGPNTVNSSFINVNEQFSSTGTNGYITGATNTYSVAVPEPGSLLLLGIGLTGLVYGRRKIKHNA